MRGKCHLRRNISENSFYSYVLAVGVRETNNSGSNQARWVVKIDAQSGSTVWQFELGNDATWAGAKSGYETIAFTEDGGFVVGGFGKFQEEGFPAFKSGGQVEQATPIIQKFSAETASATSVSSPAPVWSWVCGEGNNCSTTGSTKALRVYKDNGVEKIAAVPGTRSAIVVVDGSNGNQLQERVICWKKT